jgi:hypothetical protein
MNRIHRRIESFKKKFKNKLPYRFSKTEKERIAVIMKNPKNWNKTAIWIKRRYLFGGLVIGFVCGAISASIIIDYILTHGGK